MNSFAWIAPLVSMVLGLGVARLATDFINAVRARRTTRIDWVPLAWAICIFLTQIQFWWAFGQLALTNPTWEFGEFLGLIAFTMMLFASGAQLLPSSDKERETDLKSFFAENGRWALVTLAAFHVLSTAMNLIFFEARLFAPWVALHAVVLVLTLTVFFSRSDRVRQIATAIMLPIYVFELVMQSEPDLYALFA